MLNVISEPMPEIPVVSGLADDVDEANRCADAAMYDENFDEEPDPSVTGAQDGENEEGCVFPGRCCMPGPHHRSECYTAEMAEEYEASMAVEALENHAARVLVVALQAFGEKLDVYDLVPDRSSRLQVLTYAYEALFGAEKTVAEEDLAIQRGVI